MHGMKPHAAKEPAPEELEDDDDTPNVAPEEQEQYDDFVLAGSALIYEKGKVRASIEKMLDEDPTDLMGVLGDTEALQQFSPLVAIAATAVVIVLQLIEVGGEDMRPSDDIIFAGGQAIVEELVEIKSRMGTEIGEDEAGRAMLMAADLYREAAADKGMIDEEALKGIWNEVVTADKEGRLGDISPELDLINKAAAVNDLEGEEPEAPEEEPVE